MKKEIRKLEAGDRFVTKARWSSEYVIEEVARVERIERPGRRFADLYIATVSGENAISVSEYNTTKVEVL